MDYLFSIDPENPTSSSTGFICPGLSASEWRVFFTKILPQNQNLDSIRHNLLSNLSHRMQYLEFLHAQISYHYYCIDTYSRSTLHESILRIMIQNYIIYSFSIFEGVGTYLCRHQKNNLLGRLTFNDWRGVLSRYFSDYYFSETGVWLVRKRRKIYTNYLKKLRDLRGRIHLDEPLKDMDFHAFNKDSFKLAAFCLKVLIKKNRNNDFPNIVRLK